jgi:uncharacterized membrane protein YkoI
MRRVLRFPVIVAVGVGVLMLGALLGSGTWADVFWTEPGELACLTVNTPAGKVTSCSTVEETTLLQRLTTNYTYHAPRQRDGAGRTWLAQAAAQQPVRQTSLAQAVRVAEKQTGGRARKAEMELERSVDVYEIKTVSKAGSSKVHIDPASGNVLRVNTPGIVATVAGVLDRDDQREDQAALARLEASSMSLADAIDAAQTATGGRAVKAALKSQYGATLFEVKLVKDLIPQKVMVDPATANVVTVPSQGKRKDDD